MDMIFDTATGQLEIDISNVQPWGAELRAMINRHGYRINLHGVEMHLTVTADGAQVFDMHLPPAGVKYKQTDQDVLATGRLHWLPDQEISVSAWCKTNSGHELTAEAEFTAPRPALPYPSWTWENGQWVAPVAYPDDGGEYVWDEAAQDWTPAPDFPDPE
jgi:hypothetical protein